MRKIAMLASWAMLSATILTPAVGQTAQEQRAYDQAKRAFEIAQERYDMARLRDGHAPTRAGPAASGGDPGWPNDPALRFDYDAVRDFRVGAQYRPRTIADHDQVFRGSDGRFYCKRRDGSTGLISGMEGIRTKGPQGQLGMPMGTALDNFMSQWEGERTNAPVICH